MHRDTARYRQQQHARWLPRVECLEDRRLLSATTEVLVSFGPPPPPIPELSEAHVLAGPAVFADHGSDHVPPGLQAFQPVDSSPSVPDDRNDNHGQPGRTEDFLQDKVDDGLRALGAFVSAWAREGDHGLILKVLIHDLQDFLHHSGDGGNSPGSGDSGSGSPGGPPVLSGDGGSSGGTTSGNTGNPQQGQQSPPVLGGPGDGQSPGGPEPVTNPGNGTGGSGTPVTSLPSTPGGDSGSGTGNSLGGSGGDSSQGSGAAVESGPGSQNSMPAVTSADTTSTPRPITTNEGASSSKGSTESGRNTASVEDAVVVAPGTETSTAQDTATAAVPVVGAAVHSSHHLSEATLVPQTAARNEVLTAGQSDSALALPAPTVTVKNGAAAPESTQPAAREAARAGTAGVPAATTKQQDTGPGASQASNDQPASTPQDSDLLTNPAAAQMHGLDLQQLGRRLENFVADLAGVPTHWKMVPLAVAMMGTAAYGFLRRRRRKRLRGHIASSAPGEQDTDTWLPGSAGLPPEQR